MYSEESRRQELTEQMRMRYALMRKPRVANCQKICRGSRKFEVELKLNNDLGFNDRRHNAPVIQHQNIQSIEYRTVSVGLTASCCKLGNNQSSPRVDVAATAAAAAAAARTSNQWISVAWIAHRRLERFQWSSFYCNSAITISRDKLNPLRTFSFSAQPWVILRHAGKTESMKYFPPEVSPWKLFTVENFENWH